MNFYQHHLGDYRASTLHLSMLEHGAYLLLMQVCYMTEKPLPLDRGRVYRMVCAVDDAGKRAVDFVIDEFFERKEDGFSQCRINEELEIYHAKAGKSRDNGTLGGRPAKTRKVIEAQPRNNLEVIEAEPRNNPEVIETEPRNNLSHKPVSSNQPTPEARTPVESPDRPAQVATRLRALGVKVGMMHPTVIAIANQCVSDELIEESVRIAREDRGKESPGVSYLLPIINDLKSRPACTARSPPSATMRAVLKLESMKGGNHGSG